MVIIAKRIVSSFFALRVLYLVTVSENYYALGFTTQSKYSRKFECEGISKVGHIPIVSKRVTKFEARPTFTQHQNRISSMNSVLFTSMNDNEDEDDGWGVVSNTSSAKEKELESLRSQMNSKVESKRNMSSSEEEGGNERDLFIPIFAVVSLLGLFGAYGYEMLRLYSRGELYLPGI